MSVKAGDIVIELSLDNNGFTSRVKDSGQILRQLQGDLNRTATSVKKLEDHTESIGTKFRHLVMTMGNLRFVAMDINDVFLRLPMAILKTAGEMERLELTMTGLSNKFTELAKKAEGAANFSFVTEMAKRAPFEVGAIADAFIKFKTGGIDPTTGSLKALIDSVAKFGGNGESLKRASVAIQQMMGKGVVSMEELRQQLGEAIPTAMQDMADGVGLSMAKLAKLVKTGTLQAESAIEQMLLRMKVNNAGAAEKMMDSWVGALAKLKTEWALTAKFIYDNSGFGEAAKTALNELSTVMATDDFKRFGLSFGEGLKTAIEGMVALTKAIAENRDAIMLAIEAYVAYKIGTSIIYPALKAARDGFVDHTRSMRDNIAVTREAMNARIAAESSAAIGEMQRAQARKAELADYLAARQKELASVQARNAAIIAEDARMQARLASLRAAEAGFGVNNFGQQQSTLRAMDELARKNSELIARERELAREIAAGTVAMNAATVAAANKTAAADRLATQTGTATRAMVAMGVAMNGLKGIYYALGGWVGLVTAALIVGIEVWNHYGRAAEEAADRAKRAQQGLSTEKDFTAAKEALAAAKKELDDAKKTEKMPIPNMSGSDKKAYDAIYNARIEATRAATEKYNKAQAEFANVEKSVAASRARDAANALDVQTEREIAALDRKQAEKIQAQKARAAYEIGELNANAKDFEKKKEEISRKSVAKEMAIYLEGRKEVAALLGRQATEAERIYGDQSLGEAERNAAGVRLKSLKSRYQAAMAELTKDTKYSVPKVVTVADDDEPKITPIERLINQMKDKSAGLRVEVNNLGREMTSVEKGLAAAAEIEQKFLNGEFKVRGKDGKSTDATRQQVEEAKQLAKDHAYMEERVKDSQALTAKINDMAPGLADALETLLDPLGANKRGAKVLDIEKWFGKFDTARLSAMASAIGTTVDELRAKLTSNAAIMDIAASFNIQKMMEQTKDLNDALVEDSREAAKAKMAADNAVYENAMRKLIALAEANKRPQAEIDAMNRALDANVAARAATLQSKFKSPMEALAAQWANATRNMEEASARWAESTIDAFVQTAATGKLQFGSLVKSILADILKIQLQKNIGGAVQRLIGAAVNVIGGGSAGSDMPSFTGATAFADGGVMSAFGSIPLRKYAAGGIANSPQMAIYGEGDMNEAYVPLPDGRRIPVAMEGNTGGANVTVNVINQSGQAVSAKQGQQRFDGKQMILDVVLTAANQPGQFRDGLKGAMSK